MRIKLPFLILIVLLMAGVGLAQSPAAIEKLLLQQLDEVSKNGSYAGEYNAEKLDAANRQVKDLLMRNGRSLAILKYAFPKLKEKMYVATSADGKRRIYSWDLEDGGTMHDFANVFQYQGKSGKVYVWADASGDEGGGPFYTQIFQLPTRNGPIYLASSTFIASSSLNGQTLKAFRIDREKLDRQAKVIKTSSGITDNVGFAYDFFSVVDRPERPVELFSFDAAKKEFRFPVVIEDDKTPQGRVTDKFITYRFNGKYFVKVN